MKDSSTSDDGFNNPSLQSEPSDFFQLFGENRLRLLAKTIPSHGHHQLESITQGCIAATVYATQEFLAQVVSGLSLSNPITTRGLVVSSSGLNAISWLDRTKDTEHGWIPSYPVSGFITRGLLVVAPEFGRTPMEPAIQLLVNRADDEGDDFALSFSVSDAEDMRLLAMIIQEAGPLWDEFERIFGVTPFTSIPLPEEVEDGFEGTMSCREYASEFINHVVAKDDDGSCLESFDLKFTIRKNAPLHEPIVGAISLLNAFLFYSDSVQTMDRGGGHSLALRTLESAVTIGRGYLTPR